jgi:hypothetical protein
MAFTTQPLPARFAKSLVSHSAPILHGKEKASQSYKSGAFLIDDGSGLLAETTSPVDASAVSKRTFGLAIKDATGTTSADVPLVWLTNDVLVEITLSDNTAGAHTLAQTDQWQVYAPTKGTNNWALDANAEIDTGGMVVVGFKGKIGDSDARVYGILTNTARGGVDASSGTF